MIDVHPPGRRRLRSAVRPDGYESWTIELVQYETLRELILRVVDDLDTGAGVELKTLIAAAESELAGHPRFPSGRFTNWIRFVKVDLECEGVIERVGRSSPQRVRVIRT
jgi:uncharacterized protein DUF6958